MSDLTTKHMLPLYEQIKVPTTGFSGMFQSPEANYFNAKEVEWDVIRDDDDVAITLTDLNSGYTWNTAGVGTNKSVLPGLIKEGMSLDSSKLYDREYGDDPFMDRDFRSKIQTRVMRGMNKLEAKILRAIEWQAAQVLQTGSATLTDADGNTSYTINYSPKTAHFPTAGTSWASETTAGKIADIRGIADEINKNSGGRARVLIAGKNVIDNLEADTGVQALFDNRNIFAGQLARPEWLDNGLIYHGTLKFGGSYVYELWSYDRYYKDPQTGTKTPYLDPGKVIVMDPDARLDALFGGIPNIGKQLGVMQPILPELTGRFTMPGRGRDFFSNVWMDPNGETLHFGLGVRPLMVPTAIDMYGCLDTQL